MDLKYIQSNNAVKQVFQFCLHAIDLGDIILNGINNW